MKSGCRWSAAVVVALLGLVALSAAPDSSNASQPFVATREWQTILPGQSIPKGLHVRINMETGLKEAKLIDSDEEPKKSLTVINNEEPTSNDTSTNKTITESDEEALKNIATSKTDTKGRTFKTLNELQSEFKEMNMNIKTDMELMHDLFKQFNKIIKKHPMKPVNENKLGTEETKKSIELLDILIDFEYLVHQIDNANEFIRLKGFETVIYPLLNSTDNILKGEALKILSGALQNNIKVQIYALETNASELLLKILSLDSNEYVRSRAIRALSCLVRGFPVAQKHVLTNHGLDVFQKILASTDSSHFKLKVAILVLLDDLSLEHKLVNEFHLQDELDKVRLYQEVNLADKLSNPLFCEILSKFLQEYFDYNIMDLEYLHKIIPSMTTFSHLCKKYHYKDKKLLAKFHKVQELYNKNMAKRKASNESSSEAIEYYTNILEFIENYLNILNRSKFDDEL